MTSFAVFHDLWHFSNFRSLQERCCPTTLIWSEISVSPFDLPLHYYPQRLFHAPLTSFRSLQERCCLTTLIWSEIFVSPFDLLCITIPCVYITPAFELPGFSRSADPNLRSQYLYHLATVPIDVLHYRVFAHSVSSPRRTCRWNTSHRIAMPDQNGMGVERGLRKVAKYC